MRLLLLKRLVDLIGAAVLLVLVAPLVLGLALLIHFTLGRPVFFRQTRAGRKGRPFTLIKFRTMREAAGPDGKPLADQERLTGLGRLLRRASVDELPQILNVLRGDMSLVGPRPLLMEYVDKYTPEQAQRLAVKPGLTGWAQVNGRNAVSWEEKFQLDVWYVDNWNLRLDAQILIRTLWKVLCGEGLSHAGEATMPEFTGSHQNPDGTQSGSQAPLTDVRVEKGTAQLPPTAVGRRSTARAFHCLHKTR